LFSSIFWLLWLCQTVLFALWLFAEGGSSLLFVVAIGLLQMVLSVLWLCLPLFAGEFSSLLARMAFGYIYTIPNGSLDFSAYFLYIWFSTGDGFKMLSASSSSSLSLVAL